MKNLPIGIQAFDKLIEGDYIYVDKTEIIHQLVTTGATYFLSRPRRFGKSLLLNTIKALFEGRQALFSGLWIENQWDWSKSNPVLHFSFDAMSYEQLGLEDAISQELKSLAKSHNLELKAPDYKSQFRELIQQLHETYGKVVLLIDEYDKPIIDYLEQQTIEQAKVNREVLRNFYSVIKSADEHLQLVFITGISKFAQVSIFSHLNNLHDITLSTQYATITGYTQHELEHYFEDHLQAVQTVLGVDRQRLLDGIREWYNGYSWDGVRRVYNPFGVLRFFAAQRFTNFWFSTGSPRFLIAQMRKMEIFDVENTPANNTTFERYDIENLDLTSILFQAGYLTVKELDLWTGDMILDYPNKEVRQSMYQFLIDDLAKDAHRTDTGLTIRNLKQAFTQGNLQQVREILDGLLADLPSEVFDKKSEGLYHGLLHLVFSYLGMYAQSEVHSARSRADAVVQTTSDVYIFEFKFNKSAAEAIAQIKLKGYTDKYRSTGKKLRGIGVNFSTESKGIDEWMEEDLMTTPLP
jgi:hypothetical protein